MSSIYQRIFGFIVFVCLIYFCNLFVVFIFYKFILFKSLTFFGFLYPLISFGILGILTYFSFLINEYIYSLFYLITMLYAGFLLNCLNFDFIFILLLLFCSLNNFLINLIILIVFPILLSIYGYYHAKNPIVERITLKYKGFNNKKTILHLSDIHLGAIYKKEFIEKIVAKINELNPNVVVITGDFADGSLQVKTEWIKPFDSLTIPILFITGNHTAMHGKDKLLKTIEETNIKYIGNINYEVEGINFIGIDYEYNIRRRLQELSPYIKNNIPNVALYHIPLIKPEELKNYNIFLLLTGHTHGGQVLPLQIFAYLANQCFSGLYEWNKHYIFVSTGIGTAGMPMRIGSNAVYSLITIEDE